MGLKAIVLLNLLFLSAETEEHLEDQAQCQRSNDCFSYEYCKRYRCVDASKEPCSSSADCVAGEICNLQKVPHRCE